MNEFLFKLMLRSDLKNRHYFIRPTFILEMAPGFPIKGNFGKQTDVQGVMISLPMFAKYSRKRVTEIPMERLLVKLRDPHDEKKIRFLKESIEKVLDKQGMRD